MRKTVLLPGLCLLFCTSVRGIRERDFDEKWIKPDDLNDYDDDLLLPGYKYPNELGEPEEEKILKMEVLKTLVEDFKEAAMEVASEMDSDPKRRINIGKLIHLLKPIKPIKPPSWLHKPHKPSKPQVPDEPHKVEAPDISLDIGAEIVVPPPTNSSEDEE